ILRMTAKVNHQKPTTRAKRNPLPGASFWERTTRAAGLVLRAWLLLEGGFGALGLGVVSLQRQRGQAGGGDVNLEVMVFVGMLSGRSVEGEFVVGAGVGHGLLQHAGNVV